MNQFSKIYRYILLVTVAAILFLPLLQSKLNVFKLNPLKGDITNPTQIHFTISDWFSSKYQEEKETYLTAMFGFRSTCVRINNQITYSFFKKAKANGVIIGKDNYLYEESYLDTYNGNDFLGQDSINHTLNRLKYLTDALKKLNKQLIIVFAAGKASFYPEYIPKNYLKSNIDNTNYKAFSSGASEMGLNVIDFNSWFVKNKSTSKYPLYPKNGIHWSKYGMVLAADSIIKTIENMRGIDMSNISYSEIEIQKPHDEDNDIGDGMNLLVDLKGFDMAYPKVVINNEKKDKPNVLVISDSFYWGIYNFGISNCFGNSHFWYYNKQVYPESATKELLTDNLNVGEEILKNDVIIIMATEATLKNIGWGFIEKAESYFKGNLSSKTEHLISAKKIKDWKEYIKKDPKWLANIKLTANKKNISVDSVLTLDAIWQAQNEK